MLDKDSKEIKQSEDVKKLDEDKSTITDDEMSKISGGMGISIGPTGLPDYLGQD